MNPETNKFEKLELDDNYLKDKIESLGEQFEKKLIRPDGTPVPDTWMVFLVGELVEIKNYTFRVAYIGESNILFEPIKPEDALKEGT